MTEEQLIEEYAMWVLYDATSPIDIIKKLLINLPKEKKDKILSNFKDDVIM